jgi:predicted RNA-binding Zn-ribbon protein involved in translation (DUF1610 family)
MEDSKKKPIMIGIVVACIIAAVVITIMTSSGGSGSGIASIESGLNTWVKCSNPDCGHEYQMEKRKYLETIQEQRKGSASLMQALECPKCGEQSVYEAVKCEKCELIFFPGTVRGDFTDRCPECGHSETEIQRKGK